MGLKYVLFKTRKNTLCVWMKNIKLKEEKGAIWDCELEWKPT